jgi:Mg2+ and Co2+ transporter CorA
LTEEREATLHHTERPLKATNLFLALISEITVKIMILYQKIETEVES